MTRTQDQRRHRRGPTHGARRARRAAFARERHRSRGTGERRNRRARHGPRALPDVLITDVEMPGMSGLDVARLQGQTRVIVLTNFARAGYLRRALEAGVSGYVLKAQPANELADAVRRVHRGLRVIDPQLAAESWSADVDPLTASARDPAARDRRRKHGQYRRAARNLPGNGSQLSVRSDLEAGRRESHRGRADRARQRLAVGISSRTRSRRGRQCLPDTREPSSRPRPPATSPAT